MYVGDAEVARIRDTTTQGSGMANIKIMKMMGLKKPKNITRQDVPEVSGYRHKTKKVTHWSMCFHELC